MKKLSSKAKKITIITGTAVICIGLLSAIVYQQHTIADAGDLPTTFSPQTSSATISGDISISPVSGGKGVSSGTAVTGSAWNPSSGNASAPLTPSVSKPQAPKKPTVQGDSQNGLQPTNPALTDKTKKPSYVTPPKAPTQTSGKSNGSGSGSGTAKKNAGGSTKGNKTSGGSDPIFKDGYDKGAGGQGTTVDGDWGGGSQIGTMD